MVFDVFFLLLKNLIGRPSSVNDIGIASSKHAGTLESNFVVLYVWFYSFIPQKIALETTITVMIPATQLQRSWQFLYPIYSIPRDYGTASSDAHWMN